MNGHPLRGRIGGGNPPENEQPDAQPEASAPDAPPTDGDARPDERVPPIAETLPPPILAQKGAATGAADTLDLTDEEMLPAPAENDGREDAEDEASRHEPVAWDLSDDDIAIPADQTDATATDDAPSTNDDDDAPQTSLTVEPEPLWEAEAEAESFADPAFDDGGKDEVAVAEPHSEGLPTELRASTLSDDDAHGADHTTEEVAADIDWAAAPLVDHREDAPSTPAGRKLLAGLLIVAALGWIALVAYVTGVASPGGVALGEVPLLVAVACAPLILLALVWMMFGRTRRREAEAFTRQVAMMRAEAQALDQRLASMSANLGANRARLGELAGELEGRADQATERMRGVADELEHGASRLAQHGVTLDTAANNARADMAALVETLPDAEQRILSLSQQLQGAGHGAVADVRSLEAAIASLGARTNETEGRMREAREGLEGQLEALGRSGQEAYGRVEQAQRSTAEMVDGLLARSSATLEQIRGGIAGQAEAVQALLEQARGGIERSSSDAATALAARVRDADGALTQFGANLRQRDEQTRAMLARLDDGLGSLEERFGAFASAGDERAEAIGAQLAQVRQDLAATRAEAQEQDASIERLATRTGGMREALNGLSAFLNQQLAGDIGGAQDGIERLASTGDRLGPQLQAMRGDAAQAREALEGAGAGIEESRTALAAMLETVESGAGAAERRLAELQQSISILQDDAKSLSDQTGPQLLDALTRVQEASNRAREAAREAIAQAIPDAAEQLSGEARAKLEQVIADVVANQLAEVGQASERAVEAARAASDRLSAQMLSIGQTANALESHMAEVSEGQREGQSETFAAQVGLLMESMNSAAIDVEKILSDDVDDKSWAAYLKGERGVFTRKAVRLLSAGEARDIGAVYDEDPEFRGAVNRYIHDFEAMLRRILAERDGGVMGVTMMSSDMGKLYAALAQAVERRSR